MYGTRVQGFLCDAPFFRQKQGSSSASAREDGRLMGLCRVINNSVKDGAGLSEGLGVSAACTPRPAGLG